MSWTDQGMANQSSESLPTKDSIISSSLTQKRPTLTNKLKKVSNLLFLILSVFHYSGSPAFMKSPNVGISHRDSVSE